MRRFFRFLLDRHPRLTLSVVILGVVCGILEGAAIVLLLPLLQVAGVAAGNSSAFKMVTSIFDFFGLTTKLEVVLPLVFVIAGLVAFLQRTYQWLTAKLEIELVAQLRRDLFDGALASKWPFFLRHDNGQLTNLIYKETERVGLTVNLITLVFSLVLIVTGYLAWCMKIDPVLTAGALGCGSVLMLLLKSRVRQGYGSGVALAKINENILGFLGEALHSSKFLKASGAESWAGRRFSGFVSLFAAETLKVRTNSAMIRAIAEPLAVGFLCLVVYFSVTKFGVQGAELLVLLFIFMRTLPRIKEMQVYWNEFLLNLPAFDGVMDLLNDAQESKEHFVGENVSETFREVKFENVNFHYHPNEQILKNVNFNFKRGEVVGFAGTSGSGKSTIVDLLIGLIQPSSGAIIIDGWDLKDINLRSWRQKIAYVPQETFLYNDSIGNNIRSFEVESTHHEVVLASQKAYVEEFIRTRPAGFDSIVGDRGNQLSGGQRQRIALARAFLRKPELLILDEATSSLDSESEKFIQAAIEELKGKTTIIVIAHRLNTLKICDRILVLEKGKIVEQGDWGELANNHASRFKSFLEAPPS